jgi:hypothetical protein
MQEIPVIYAFNSSMIFSMSSRGGCDPGNLPRGASIVSSNAGEVKHSACQGILLAVFRAVLPRRSLRPVL